MKRSALAVLAVLAGVLLAVGCGGGSGSGSSTSGPHDEDTHRVPSEPGAGKKATAPSAPAGSKVVTCAAGTGGTVELRATDVDCGTAERTMRHWGRVRSCVHASGASRSSCSLGGFRCQAVQAGRGAAVSCARPGGDVSFVAKIWPLKKDGSG